MFKSTKLLKVITFLFILNSVNVTFGQYFANIKFDGENKEVRKTKSILKKYNIQLILSGEEINVEFVNDNSFRIDSLSNNQIEQLRTQEGLLVRLSRNNRCYYGLLPNGFFDPWGIRCLIIYNVGRRIRYLGEIKSRYLAVNFCYTNEQGLYCNIPLSIVPCDEYEGQYDNGLYDYIRSKKK